MPPFKTTKKIKPTWNAYTHQGPLVGLRVEAEGWPWVSYVVLPQPAPKPEVRS